MNTYRRTGIIRNRCSSVCSAIVAFMLLSVWTPSAGAQAVFNVSKTDTAVTRTGQTELIGSVNFSVASGTTTAGVFELDISPAVVTNSATTGITVTGTGGLAAATLGTVVASSGIVFVNVPGGGGAGDVLTLSGIRVSPTQSDVTTINARISSTSNFITANQNTFVLAGTTTDGLVVDSDADNSFTFTSNIFTDTLGIFQFSEGAVTSFSSAIGTLGQTVATQVIFEITGIPDNVTVTFPASMTGDSGATLTTQSGLAVAVTNQSTSNRVVYVFADSIPGPNRTENFVLAPVVTTTGFPGNGTAFIQVTLGPEGAASPTTALPSTAIPRYQESLLPPLGNSNPNLNTFIFPVSTLSTTQQIAVSNAGSGGAFVTFRAFAADGTLLAGTGITNPFSVTIAVDGTVVSTLSELFGAGVDSTDVAAVHVETQHVDVLANSVGTVSAGRYLTGVLDAATALYLPYAHSNTVDVPVVALYNAGTAAETVTMTLRTMTGSVVATALRTLNANSSARETVTALFGLAAGNIPISGYIVADSANARVSLVEDTATGSTEVPGLGAVRTSRVVVPYVVFGGGFNTTLSIVNATAFTNGSLRVTPVPSGGTAMTSVERTIGPLERTDLDLNALFGGSQATLGSLILDVSAASVNPFSTPPLIAGSVTVGLGSASAVAPLGARLASVSSFSPVTANAAEYTGIAITNDNSVASTSTVEVFDASGTSLGTGAVAVPAGDSSVKLIREIVTGALGVVDGYVKVTSTVPVSAVAYRGTTNLSDLIHIGAQ